MLHVLNENPGAVQIIAKAAGSSWVKALLLMRVAERRLSKVELERARESFEQFECRTVQRVIEFYETRRSALGHAGAAMTMGETARLEATMG